MRKRKKIKKKIKKKDKKEDKKEEKIEDKKENIPIDDLNEILNYYKNFLFDSKKEEIENIENIIKNNNGNYNDYLNDLEEAKKMNQKYEIINKIFELKNKDNKKTEKNFKKNWEQLERQIKEQKLSKMRNDDRAILYDYFEKNKELGLSIFGQDSYEYFMKNGKKKKDFINIWSR